jgi:hypothetical protein
MQFVFGGWRAHPAQRLLKPAINPHQSRTANPTALGDLIQAFDSTRFVTALQEL